MMKLRKSKGISLIFICFTVSCVAVLLYIIMIPKEIAFESVTNKLKGGDYNNHTNFKKRNSI